MRRALVAATMIFTVLHLLAVAPSAAESSPRESLKKGRCPRREAVTQKIERGLAYYWSFDNENALDSVREVDGRIIGDVAFTDGVLGKAVVIQDDTTHVVMVCSDDPPEGDVVTSGRGRDDTAEAPLGRSRDRLHSQ